MSKRFSDFVNRMLEEAKTSKPGFDPSKRIESYRRYVNALYADIDKWLKEGLEAGKVKTGLVPIPAVLHPERRNLAKQSGNTSLDILEFPTFL